MRTLLLILALVSPVIANDLYVVDGGISPDKKLAIAVVPQKDSEYIDEADGSSNAHKKDNRRCSNSCTHDFCGYGHRS